MQEKKQKNVFFTRDYDDERQECNDAMLVGNFVNYDIASG